MTILTLNKRGALKLPKEILSEFNGAKHLMVRVTSTGVALTPVQIHAAADLKAIPEAKPKSK